jgi:hypothetical protein
MTRLSFSLQISLYLLSKYISFHSKHLSSSSSSTDLAFLLLTICNYVSFLYLSPCSGSFLFCCRSFIFPLQVYLILLKDVGQFLFHKFAFLISQVFHKLLWKICVHLILLTKSCSCVKYTVNWSLVSVTHKSSYWSCPARA